MVECAARTQSIAITLVLSMSMSRPGNWVVKILVSFDIRGIYRWRLALLWIRHWTKEPIESSNDTVTECDIADAITRAVPNF